MTAWDPLAKIHGFLPDIDLSRLKLESEEMEARRNGTKKFALEYIFNDQSNNVLVWWQSLGGGYYGNDIFWDEDAPPTRIYELLPGGVKRKKFWEQELHHACVRNTNFQGKKRIRQGKKGMHRPTCVEVWSPEPPGNFTLNASFIFEKGFVIRKSMDWLRERNTTAVDVVAMEPHGAWSGHLALGSCALGSFMPLLLGLTRCRSFQSLQRRQAKPLMQI
eukprot:gnl/TRDRNA2_/TRDRNA2_31964_c0_seq1.p1 gnl/TRDRNA2_/TRDRNA2_31964_c0~~gnl/TRDRNA2_/TRDRNA2_31964_c0_seq1.p1  ORF type:complete len:219 (+),score=31.53 gnl/TRDRNA2_/TRDRNA2_31964_c0_seq1:79-735(+)